MKFNGTSWVTVGTSGFSAGAAGTTRIALNNSGEPFVVYADAVNSSKATVMKFNGTSWITVCSAGFSAGMADDTHLALNSSGEPYVLYTDEGNSYKATVMKFVGLSTGMEDIKELISISISPNPTKGIINFSEYSNVQLTNITGQIIADLKNVNAIDLTNQLSGIYFLTLTNNDRKVVQRCKIVKE